MPADVFIINADGVAEGDTIPFKYKGRPAIVIMHNGQIRAFINVCTHHGGQVELRGDVLECIQHHATFNAETGKALTMPAPLMSSLLEIAIETRDGKIYHKNT